MYQAYHHFSLTHSNLHTFAGKSAELFHQLQDAKIALVSEKMAFSSPSDDVGWVQRLDEKEEEVSAELFSI